MSIVTTLAQIELVLQQMNPPLNVVKTAPTESVSNAEFPMAMCMLAPQMMNSFRMEASGYVRHVYHITVYIFAGMRNTGLTELHNRILPYPQELARVLFANMTLNGNVTFIGDMGGGLYSYRYGEIGWGEARLWGLVTTIQVTEKIITETN